MKIQFKHQQFQTAAVEAVADCFEGQPRIHGSALSYKLDPGIVTRAQVEMDYDIDAFPNAPLQLDETALLDNIRKVQHRSNLPQSKQLVATPSSRVNLDVEMETGTGKTYVYIRTMFELHRRHGWSKFIIVVPSIAIREGVQKSLEITAEHFLEDYGRRIRFFTYSSKRLHELEHFATDGGINVMVINSQAFVRSSKSDPLKIDDRLDEFQSRRPIDVISCTRPILIIDEPQRLEGPKTQQALAKFKPLFVLRYSATHRTTHNKIHRLDALDAYQQKLVKKIRVHGIAQKGLSGTNRYLYLESIELSTKAPLGRLELEVKDNNGSVRRVLRKVGVGDNLMVLANGLRQYEGCVVSEVDAIHGIVAFTNGLTISVGEVTGEIHEQHLRRIQIRETIRAHFERERRLFSSGVKVLSLFFIDEVAKYRRYDDVGEQPGDYARMFEEEYNHLLNEVLELELDNSPYQRFLSAIDTQGTHNGYFSIDKRSHRLVDPNVAKRGENAGLTDDVDAYDLILRDKETLLSLPGDHDSEDVRRRKQVRFIFSHSALREGWDNPNVFTICTLKHSDNNISRRQEVGRGMRLAVNQFGERVDHPATVHDVNVLTVVASESYEDFVRGLQSDIHASLSERPRKATEAYFADKVIATPDGLDQITVTAEMAKELHRYLIKHDYIDNQDEITKAWHEARQTGTLAPLPTALAEHAEQVALLVDSVFSEAALPQFANARRVAENRLNDNFHKKEFQQLWKRINRKAVYQVEFESDELIGKAVKALNSSLRVDKLRFSVTRGEQTAQLTPEDLAAQSGFQVLSRDWELFGSSLNAQVGYDLLGAIAEPSRLTRGTVAAILSRLEKPVFAQFKSNPEAFIARAATLIREQLATLIIEHLSYDPLSERHEADIFAQAKDVDCLGDGFEVRRHIYDYVFTESKIERAFVEQLDTHAEVVVYGKLPRGFSIPTPVGDYNPDWAIAFESDKVRHIYFIAETKGSMSTLQLKKIEEAKAACARKFFARISEDQVKYDVVDSYAHLIGLVT